MIRSAALFYAVVVALLVSTAMGAVLLTTHLKNMRTERWLALNSARDAAHNGLMACAIGLPDGEAELEPSDTILRSAWGLFQHCACSAGRADQRYKLSALIAHRRARTDHCLWLADHGDPISLAGSTAIRGTCSLPKAGTRRAYIEGKPLSGIGVEGTMLISERQLPPLPQRTLDALAMMERGAKEWRGRSVPLSALETDSLYWPMDREPLIVDAGSFGNLDKLDLSGHVVVLASDSLVVKAGCDLRSVLLIAPHIVLEQGCSITVQCFASRSISVKEDVEMGYPSVLVCHLGDTARSAGTVTIGEGSSMAGTIIGLGSTVRADAHVAVSLGVGTSMIGELWNNGPTEVRGTFEGLLISDRLFVRTASSVYRDHLLDAFIQPLQDNDLAFPGTAGDDAHATILQWTHNTGP